MADGRTNHISMAMKTEHGYEKSGACDVGCLVALSAGSAEGTKELEARFASCHRLLVFRKERLFIAVGRAFSRELWGCFSDS